MKKRKKKKRRDKKKTVDHIISHKHAILAVCAWLIPSPLSK